ncbi:hypothetical protein HF086_018283 [Spodoptera exigua]|uniref:Choline/ethanolamine kinase n=1 Tax=Spodoptera exigua TaxID=7107 RepID=A0A922S876_SPOEX|nr:hypothetical protein HF086_018283 [Spodoptera exigua]
MTCLNGGATRSGKVRQKQTLRTLTIRTLGGIWSRAPPSPLRNLERIYGQVHGERAMDAIVTESVIFTLLSERRLGPKLHGVFSGGRIEQYIPQLKNTDLEKEIEWLKKFLATVDSPVVFCHNDMQEGNILLVEDTQTAADDDVSQMYVQSFESDENRTGKNGSIDKDHFDSQFEDANTSDTVLSHMSDWGEPKLEIFIREYLKHYQANVSDKTEVSLDDVNKLLDEVEALDTYLRLKLEVIKKDKYGLPQKRKICEVDI